LPVTGKPIDGCQPHLAGFRTAAAPHGDLQAVKDPLFIDKVRDIVGLYLNPPDKALVLCIDEKSLVASV
jgi:hypothetical protein